MAATATVTRKWFDGKQIIIIGTIALTGSYVAGGDTLSFAIAGVFSSRVPLYVSVEGRSGWSFKFKAGTTIANGLLQVRGQQPTSATAGVIPLDEMAAGAYPASATGDVIDFIAVFDRV